MTPSRSAHDRRWLTLAALCTCLAIVGIDNTILNVALPTLLRTLHASTSDLQWIVDAYVLVFAGLLLTAGTLGDRFGRRRALEVGLLIFGLGSLASAFSGSAGQLIATRAVMGVGGAFIMPATLSILTNVFTDPAERARAIGIWAAVSGVGVAVGPLAGGWLLEHFWWGSVFLVNVPVVLAALVLSRLLVPESRDPHQPPLDVTGALLSIAGLVALVWTLIEAPGHGWRSATTLGGFAVAVVLLALFAAWESRVEHPMLDIAFFRRRRFSGGSVAITVVFFTLFGSLFLFTQVLQFVLGYTALKAGAALIPFALVLAMTAAASPRLVERLGSKVVVAGGMVLVAIGLADASLLTVAASYLDVCLALVVIGVGMALVMPPATEAVMGSLPVEKAGIGSAVNDTTREVGGALGVAVLGSIASSAYAASMASKLHGTGMPARVAEVVQASLGGAVQVAGRIGGDAGAALADAARAAFMDAVGTAMLVAAGFAVLGAVAVLLFLPARGDDPAVPEEPQRPDDDLGRVLEPT